MTSLHLGLPLKWLCIAPEKTGTRRLNSRRVPQIA
jgi:hypothetical protein